jgi:hypothetical protein
MQTNTLVLMGLMMVIFLASRKKVGVSQNQPRWVEELKGWQVIFGLAALVVAFLMMLNPEFMALGLLGDTAFFDLLVLALGLQFRTVALGAWARVGWIFSKVRAHGIRSWQRDYAMVVIALGPICGAVLAVGRVVGKVLRGRENLIS